MFYPGEIVVQTFTVPFYINDIQSAVVSYKQNGNIILEKEATSEAIMEESDDPNEEPFETGESLLTVELSEKDTLLFKDNTEFTMQVNIFSLGARQTSNPIKDRCGEQYLRDLYENLNLQVATRDTTPSGSDEEEEEVTENAE